MRLKPSRARKRANQPAVARFPVSPQTRARGRSRMAATAADPKVHPTRAASLRRSPSPGLRRQSPCQCQPAAACRGKGVQRGRGDRREPWAYTVQGKACKGRP
eukprot:scaffold13760_cov90-Isochrysis_galbana.AAC.1